jgi:hypothetical protein
VDKLGLRDPPSAKKAKMDITFLVSQRLDGTFFPEPSLNLP